MKFYKTTFFDSLYRADIEIIITGYEKDTDYNHIKNGSVKDDSINMVSDKIYLSNYSGYFKIVDDYGK